MKIIPRLNLGQQFLTGWKISPWAMGGLWVVLAGLAHGQIFVTDATNGTIGQYDFSGAAINPALIAGLSNPHGLAISGSNIFVVQRDTASLGEYTTAGATVNASLVTGFTTPSDVVVSGNNLYVTDVNANTVGEFSTSGAVVNATLISNLDGPTGLAVSGNNLYVVNNANNTIGEYDATSGAVINATLVTGLKDPYGIVVLGGNLFVANRNNGKIAEYNATTGAAVNTALVQALALPFGLATDGVNLYVASTTNKQVGEYVAANGTTVNTSLLTGFKDPYGVAVALAAPDITCPPVLDAVVAGVNATFNVAASGEPAPTYQWQVSTDGGVTWNNVSGNAYAGGTTATLTVNAATTTQLGYQYQVVLSNLAGLTTTTPVPLVVGTSNAKLAWLQNNFSLTQLGLPSVVGDLATPANDGIFNLIKYALNLNPLVNGQSFLPQPTLSAGNLVLVFQAPQSDLSYTVQASTDLSSWSTTGVNTQVNGTQITASYAIPGNTPAFLRILVAPAP